MRRRSLHGGLLAAGASIGVGGCLSAAPKQAPDFMLTSLDGDEVRLSDHRGRVVLLHFFDTNDRWGRMLLSRLAMLDERYREEGLSILGVSLDGPKTRAALRALVTQRNVTFPVLVDEATEVAALYNPSRMVPYGVVVDREGNVWGYWNGFHPGELPALAAELERALAGRQPSEAAAAGAGRA